MLWPVVPLAGHNNNWQQNQSLTCCNFSRIYYSVGSSGGVKPSQTPFMMFFDMVASPLRGTLKLSITSSSPEQVNQQCQNHTDDHHGRYGYEYHPALSLDAYITRQAAKPAESPGCEL